MNINDIIENAQLKGRIIALDAQVETLTAEVRCLEAVIRSHERVDCLSVTSLKKQLVEAEAENARLKAEVERLTKAGDAMANNIPYYADVDISAETLREFTEKWHAAKEGKQS
jgi:cell division protein FtsB